MRITKRQLKRIIREEKNKLIAETRLRRTIRRVIREADEIPPEEDISGEEEVEEEVEEYIDAFARKEAKAKAAAQQAIDDGEEFVPYNVWNTGDRQTIDEFPTRMKLSIDVPGLPDGRAGLDGMAVNNITAYWKSALMDVAKSKRKKLRNNKSAAQAVAQQAWSINHSIAIAAHNEEGIPVPSDGSTWNAFSDEAKKRIKQFKAKLGDQQDYGEVPGTGLLPYIESYEGYKASELNAMLNHPEYDAVVHGLQNNHWNGNFGKNPKSKRRSLKTPNPNPRKY